MSQDPAANPEVPTPVLGVWHILPIGIGLGIAYLPMWAPRLAGLLGIDLPGDGPASALWVNWIAVALLLSYVFFIERQGLGYLLMVRPRAGDIEWAFYFFGAFMAYSWVIGLIREQPNNDGTATIVAMPILAVIALILTAGITEEILFRAYPIERISSLTGRRWIYVLYLWRRNLYARMTLHVLINPPSWVVASTPMTSQRNAASANWLDVDPTTSPLGEAANFVHHVITNRGVEVGFELHGVLTCCNDLQAVPGQVWARRHIIGTSARVPGAKHKIELTLGVGAVSCSHQLAGTLRLALAMVQRLAAGVVGRSAPAGAY